MGAKYKFIKVDRELCIGAASCVAVYPEVFQLDEENKAILLKNDGRHTSEQTQVDVLSCSTIDDDQLLLAAQSCPTAAISLYGSDGTQLYPEM